METDGLFGHGRYLSLDLPMSKRSTLGLFCVKLAPSNYSRAMLWLLTEFICFIECLIPREVAFF
jgi:hypothetical protein